MIKRAPPDSRFTFPQWLLVAVGTGLSCLLGFWYLRAGDRTIGPIWTTAGISMAFFVRYGWRAAPPVITGHLVAWWTIYPDMQLRLILAIASIFTAEAWLVSFVGYRNRKMVAANPAAMGPAACSYLVAPILCAVPCAWIAAMVLAHAGKFPADAPGKTMSLIALAQVHGFIVFGSLALHLLQRDFRLSDLKKSGKGVLAGIAALVVMILAFQGSFNDFLDPNSAIFLPFPLLVMAAVWLSPASVSLLVAAWCVVSSLLTISGHGPFSLNPAELGLYNIVMASVAYLVAVGSAGLRKQLDLHEMAVAAAGIELWEWEAGLGFSHARENPTSGFVRAATAGRTDQRALARLAGIDSGLTEISDTWRVRIRNAEVQPNDPAPALLLESVGRVLQRGQDGRPVKAVGLLQDLSAMQKAEETLVALEDQKARLRSLQAQLNPHFFFNSLNVIRALVHIDPTSADKAITSLADLLRVNFRTTETTLIGLGAELEQIRALLHLGRLRFGARLETRIRVPQHLLAAPVPPMLLLNLVENAITHGISKLENGGMIAVSAKAIGNEIRISIRNSGTLPENAVWGLGTRDALQRLEILFGSKARLSLSQMNEKTVSADVHLPFPCPSFS